MRLKGFLLILLSLFGTYVSFAQSSGELTQSRILILLDESSSMIQKWPSGKEKYKAADELILHLMDSIYAINDQVEFSLRVFGHQYTVEQNNCYDTKNEVPFSKDNRTQMSLRLDDIHPLGVTPIAFALTQAAKYDLVDEEHNAYSIILITDGGESCGGDICEVMKKLMKYKVYFKPYIVSLEDDPSLKTTYSCMGDFLQVTKDSDMPRAVSTIVNAFRPVIKLTRAEYKQIQVMAANVPSVLSVSIPVITTNDSIEKTLIKKESGLPVATKPVKDSIMPPPIIKESREKPAAENIARLVLSKKNLLATPSPARKALKPERVPVIEVIMIPAAENIAGLTPIHLRMVNYLLPAPKLIETIAAPSAPAVEVPVTITPESITHLTIASAARIAIATPLAKKLHKVEEPEAPAVEVPVTITPESITHITIAPAMRVAIAITPAKKLHKVEEPEAPAVEVPVTITPESITHLTMAPAMRIAIVTPPAKRMHKVEEQEAPAVEVPVTITPESITHLTIAPAMRIVIATPPAKKLHKIEAPEAPAIEVPVTITPESITHIAAVRSKPVAIAATAAKKLKTVEPGIPPPLVIDTPVAPRKTDKIAKLQPVMLKGTHNIFVIEDKAIFPRAVPPPPPLKLEVVKPPVGKTPIVKTPVAKTTPVVKESDTPGKKADYTVKTEDAKETTLAVILTNGKGRFFNSTPQMLLMEPGTNKVIKKFYRTVDEAGNPDPQTNIPVGTYNLALSANMSLTVNNVKIQEGKKNIITVIVKPCSISFAYDNAPGRPVSEFVAKITERNKAQGRVQDQKCTDRIEYDPGNYHIMINTFPQTDRNVDIDFDETVITIPQPGFVKFIADDKVQTVMLYKQEGDKYLSFYTMGLGNPAAQHLRMQPGLYQAHYHIGPGGPSASEKVKVFQVKATEEVPVELK